MTTLSIGKMRPWRTGYSRRCSLPDKTAKYMAKTLTKYGHILYTTFNIF